MMAFMYLPYGQVDWPVSQIAALIGTKNLRRKQCKFIMSAMKILIKRER
jgi:hypothetical protein